MKNVNTKIHDKHILDDWKFVSMKQEQENQKRKKKQVTTKKTRRKKIKLKQIKFFNPL